MEQDIFIGRFEDADPAVVAAHFGRVLTADSLEAGDYYKHLTERHLVHVPRGVTAKEPLTLDFTSEHFHLLIVLEEDAHAVIIEHLSRASSLSHGIEIVLGVNASLTFLQVQALPPSAKLRIRQQSAIGAGARLEWQNVTLGGAEVDQTLRSEVRGAGGESSIDWVFYAKDAERYTLSVRNIFNAREGSGEITMKGVAEERAHVGARGLIDIGLQAGGTDTYLTQDVLMLDPTSKVDAIPGLEIKTNDVKASHSATVARVTPEDLFYFGARGIPEKVAREMYVLGFLSDLTGKIADERAKEKLGELVEAKFRRE
jgi:Fe-S cluster assembly protein SufB/Fe-S cluster assembly protein SufD